LIVEGAIPKAEDGIYGAIGEKEGRAVTMVQRVESLGSNALSVIALGTCAAFGGIPAADPNPTGCVGVGEALRAANISTPVINVPGCPPHPDWLVGTLAHILLLGLPKAEDLDEYGRPKAFYGQLIHENCPRRAYYDEGKFAKKLGDPGCLYELGCKGPVTYADCPLRLWNNGVNWCIGAGSPCLGCVEPGFPDLVSPLYEKMAASGLPNIGEVIRR
jgi:hydrogenase small subunit